MAYKFIQLYNKDNVQVYPTKGPNCYISTNNNNTAYWYKFATVKATGQNQDASIAFQVNKSYSAFAFGILYLHLRIDTGTTFSNVNLQWVSHSTGIRPRWWVVNYNGTTADLYCYKEQQWQDSHIEVISGETIATQNYSLAAQLTLYNSANTTGSTALPTTGTNVYSYSAMHKVGDIICTTNATNPQTYYGGTWEQITNRFLIGASSTYGVGKTGGSDGVTLTSAYIPAHTHGLNGHTHSFGAQTGDSGWHQHWCGSTNGASGSYEFVRPEGWSSGNGDRTITGNGTHSHWVSGTTGGNSGNTTSYGSSSPTKISTIPPWYGAYFWRRTA